MTTHPSTHGRKRRPFIRPALAPGEAPTAGRCDSADYRRCLAPVVSRTPPSESATMTSAQTPLTVMVFPGTQTMPLFAAEAQGFFSKRGLAVELKAAPSSEEQ